ncbi:MAG TPA: hypothetical protein VJO35_07845 [Terriglobales bacterium]|nr:hypothetical protein [Terriglobales bacterium]
MRRSARSLLLLGALTGMVSARARAQEPTVAFAREILLQASQLVPDIPEPQRMNAASNIANAQVRANDLRGALATLHLLKKPYEVSSGMGIMAFALDSSGKLDDALQFMRDAPANDGKDVGYEQLAQAHAQKKDFSNALRIADLIQNNPSRSVETLTRVAELQWGAGDHPAAERVWDKALEVAEQARKQDPGLASLLVGIATSRVQAGDTAPGYTTLDEFRSIVEQQQPPDQGKLSVLAMGYVQVGDSTTALRIAKALPAGSNRDICFMSVSIQLSKTGDLADAEATAAEISDAHLQTVAFNGIAEFEAESDRPTSAIDVITRITNFEGRAEALASLALEQAKRGDDAAAFTLELASRAAEESKSVPEHVFEFIAVAHAILGEFASAEKIVKTLPSAARTWPWWNITEMMVEAGKLDEAIELASNEDDAHPKAYALLGTANGVLSRLKREAEKSQSSH